MWKKKIFEKLSILENFDRFCGMFRYQVMWYIWKGDLKMGIIMFDLVKKICDDQCVGRMFSLRILVVDFFFSLTQIKLVKMGQSEE